MNKVFLMGRLTRDPEVRYSQGDRQMAIARYTLAVDRRRSANNTDSAADFIPCVAFDRSAEFAERYFRQGTKVLVTGRIQTGSYTNRDGVKVYTTEVIVDEQEFAESKASASQSSAGQPPVRQEFPDRQSRSGQEPASGFMPIPDEIEDDGLPFL